MFPGLDESLLREKVKLYNNIAKFRDCTGRLDAELQVYPSPQIIWEFEILGDEAEKLEIGSLVEGKLQGSITGIDFFIDGIQRNEVSIGGAGPSRKQIRGVATRAGYGKLDSLFSSVSFCLPNARFHSRNKLEPGLMVKLLKGEMKTAQINSEKRSHRAPLNDTWSVYLETRKEALDWLNPDRGNNGARLTTIGRLYHPTQRLKGSVKLVERPSFAFDEVQSCLGKLCALLSYANGGYLGPLLIECYYRKDEWSGSTVVILPYRTTPLEQIGTSWLAVDSSLGSYLQCFPTFDRMLTRPAWKDAFDLILAWYFQAIQPQDTQSGEKPWPVVANAVGTALERLCHAILVADETNTTERLANESLFRIGKSQERIIRLLKRIGITRDSGCHDSEYVKLLTTVRNDATHPRPASMSNGDRWKILQRAIQWIDEVLLWRLGYNGTYISRITGGRPTEPRYDLSLRDPCW